MKNLLLALLGCTAIASTFIAWRQYTELVELRAAAGNAGERTELQKRIVDLQKQNRDLQVALEQEAGALEMSADASATATPRAVPETGATDRSEAREERRAQFRELLAKPEVQALITSAERAGVELRYAALFRGLNLPAEQAERLEALLVDRQNSRRDVMAALEQQGLSPRSDPEAFRKMVADAEATVDANIKSLIGESGYNQLAQFERTQPQRQLVTTLQQHLSSTDTPLSYAQSEQLVQILAANAPPRNGDNTPGRFVMAPGTSGLGGVLAPHSARITNDAVAQASTVLNSTQLAALKLLQQQQRNSRQLQQLLRGGSPKR